MERREGREREGRVERREGGRGGRRGKRRADEVDLIQVASQFVWLTRKLHTRTSVSVRDGDFPYTDVGRDGS